MPYKGISVGLFFSCFEKIGKHHEPRKRTTYAADGTSGGTGVGAIPSLQRGAACNRSGNAKHSARPDIHSSLRVQTGAIPSLSCSGYPNAALSRHALRHALWRLSTTWLHRTSAQPAPHGANGKCQRPTIARATVFRQHGKTTQSRRSQPREPQATLLDTSNHRLAIPNKRFSSSPQQRTHTLCSQRRRSPTPKRCSNRLRMPTRASSLSCPPLWNRQHMAKITPTR